MINPIKSKYTYSDVKNNKENKNQSESFPQIVVSFRKFIIIIAAFKYEIRVIFYLKNFILHSK